jgi:sarcosine oxidase subunit beta
MSVIVLERGRCGAGASGVNFGGVRQQGRDFAELPLARRARPLWDTLSSHLGEDVEFVASGHVKLARSEADMAELERYARDAAAFGLRLELLGRSAVQAQLPWLGAGVVGASLCAEDGHANPRVVGPAYARLARQLGADVREHAPVLEAARDGDGFALRSDALEVRSRFLVNCAGAAAGGFAAAFGEDVPLAPLVPNMLVSEPLPFFIDRSVGVCGGAIYLRQTARGNAILGGGDGWADAECSRSRPLTEASLQAMASTLAIVPGLAGSHVIRTWTGIDGQMPDQIPVIGFSSTTPNLVHAFGFSGHGFQLGPVVGEIIAELVTEGRSVSPLEPFAIDRFFGWSESAAWREVGVEH